MKHNKGERNEKPNQPAEGVQTLLVNRELVIAEGKLLTDAAPGQPIRGTTSSKVK